MPRPDLNILGDENNLDQERRDNENSARQRVGLSSSDVNVGVDGQN